MTKGIDFYPLEKPLKTTSKIVTQKMVEVTGYLAGNKVAEKITKATLKTTYEDPSKLMAHHATN